MDPSVPKRGPQLDVVLIVFFINPRDLCKASSTQHRLSEPSAGFSFGGIFLLLLFTSWRSQVKAKREFANSAVSTKVAICLNKNTSKELVHCSWIVCLLQ